MRPNGHRCQSCNRNRISKYHFQSHRQMVFEENMLNLSRQPYWMLYQTVPCNNDSMIVTDQKCVVNIDCDCSKLDVNGLMVAVHNKPLKIFLLLLFYYNSTTPFIGSTSAYETITCYNL